MMISEEVFNQLYKKYYLDIFKFAFSYVKRKDLAEDVLQDTFIELYLHSPKSNGKIKSWLFKVAKNKCMDIIRKERKEEKIIDNLKLEKNEKYSSDSKINKTEILKFIDEIPYKYSKIIKLYYYGNLSTKEISKVIFISESLVRKRLERGRNLLRKILEEKENEYR